MLICMILRHFNYCHQVAGLVHVTTYLYRGNSCSPVFRSEKQLPKLISVVL